MPCSDSKIVKPSGTRSAFTFGLPIPLSATESFQSAPDTSYATVISPSFVSALKACFSAFITSSVTINPKVIRKFGDVPDDLSAL
jgi:hypothetical protein